MVTTTETGRQRSPRDARQVGTRGRNTYSRAPTLRLSYSLSFSKRWTFGSMIVTGRRCTTGA